MDRTSVNWLAALVGSSLLIAMPGAYAKPAKSCLISTSQEVFEEDTPDSVNFPTDIEERTATSGSECGRNSEFLNTYGLPGNIIRVGSKSGGGIYLPLALYRMKSPKTCNQIKVRTACYSTSVGPDGLTKVHLFDPDTRSKKPAEFSIDRAGKVIGLDPEFALIKGKFGPASKPSFSTRRIAAAVEEFMSQRPSCKRGRSSKDCLKGVAATAEDWALQRLRYDRFPHELTVSEKNSDWAEFEASIGHLDKIQTIVNSIMVANETGIQESPYELSDATDAAGGKSALSFGVIQLDVGSKGEHGKETEARKIFWLDIHQRDKKMTFKSAKARTFLLSRAVMRPIREFSPDELFYLHEGAPELTSAFRTEQAKLRYNAHHHKFLNDQEVYFSGKMKEKCGFNERPSLIFMAIDRFNQTGSYDGISRIVKAGCKAHKPPDEIVLEARKSYGSYYKRADFIVETSKKARLE